MDKPAAYIAQRSPEEIVIRELTPEEETAILALFAGISWVAVKNGRLRTAQIFQALPSPQTIKEMPF